jgi:hypothetical protein
MKVLPHTFLTLAIVSVSATAQSTTSVSWAPPTGSRIRVLSPTLGERQTGVLLSADNDSVMMRVEKFDNPIVVRSSDITVMEVSTGTHTSKLKWSAIGLLAGAGIGALIGSATYTQCKDSLRCITDIGGRSGSIALGAVAGALTGGVAGLLLGSPHRESWVAVRR